MKKTKVLVPAIALLGLGIAATTTATVAWFTVATTVNVKQASTSEVVTLKAESAQTSYIKWTVAPVTSSVALDLTDDNGKSWYWDTATSSAVEYTPTTKAAAVQYNITAALDSAHESDTVFSQAYAQMYVDHEFILIKVTVGDDVRADTAHTAVADHSFSTTAGVDFFYRVAKQNLAADATSATDLKAFTISVKGHDGAEDIASASTLYDTEISVQIGYANDATGTGFVAFAS